MEREKSWKLLTPPPPPPKENNGLPLTKTAHSRTDCHPLLSTLVEIYQKNLVIAMNYLEQYLLVNLCPLDNSVML